jgi:hypothetical protein
MQRRATFPRTSLTNGLAGLGSLLFALATGCDDDNESAAETATHFCDSDTRAPDFTFGREVLGQTMRATLVESMPAPPRLGKTYFTLAFTDLNDVPLDDLAISVRTYMPDHMHGSPSEAQIISIKDPQGRAGHYSIGPIDFHMQQYWEVTFSTTTSSVPPQRDSVMFNFCIAN